MVRSISSARPRVDPTAIPLTGIRSRRVRKILKLDARAARLLARYQRTLACAEPVLKRAEALRREMRALELTLTGTEFGELRRVRSGAGAATRRS
jgi:hypothetical protein